MNESPEDRGPKIVGGRHEIKRKVSSKHRGMGVAEKDLVVFGNGKRQGKGDFPSDESNRDKRRSMA